jgi:hypothetical protein
MSIFSLLARRIPKKWHLSGGLTEEAERDQGHMRVQVEGSKGSRSMRPCCSEVLSPAWWVKHEDAKGRRGTLRRTRTAILLPRHTSRGWVSRQAIAATRPAFLQPWIRIHRRRLNIL